MARPNIVHPSGKFVYASNRGHNTIAAFGIDQSTGMLNPIGWTSTQGAIPRGFNIDPSGRMMLVGNQNSDSVVPFGIHQFGPAHSHWGGHRNSGAGELRLRQPDLKPN